MCENLPRTKWRSKMETEKISNPEPLNNIHSLKPYIENPTTLTTANLETKCKCNATLHRVTKCQTQEIVSKQNVKSNKTQSTKMQLPNYKMQNFKNAKRWKALR